MKSARCIFQHASTTFFFATLFFPKHLRLKIYTLYAFVRVIDDFIDVIPQQSHAYFNFKQYYYNQINGHHNTAIQLSKTETEVIRNFIQLQHDCNFDQSWVDAFLRSMEMDLSKTTYNNLNDLQEYIYGSASVIGLFMSRIMQLPDSALPYAEKLGSAFQLMNMIRDINEDLSFNRVYIPQTLLEQYHLNDLNYSTVKVKSNDFYHLIVALINQYNHWKNDAAYGFKFIPRHYLIAIRTAIDMFDWTLNIIKSNPLIIYQKKVKPTRLLVVKTGIINTIKSYIKL